MSLLQNAVFRPEQKICALKKLVRTAVYAVLTNFFFGLIFQNLILQQTQQFQWLNFLCWPKSLILGQYLTFRSWKHKVKFIPQPLLYQDELKLSEPAFPLHSGHIALSRSADSAHRHKPPPGNWPDLPCSNFSWYSSHGNPRFRWLLSCCNVAG